jgi:hypothetical protein
MGSPEVTCAKMNVFVRITHGTSQRGSEIRVREIVRVRLREQSQESGHRGSESGQRTAVRQQRYGGVTLDIELYRPETGHTHRTHRYSVSAQNTEKTLLKSQPRCAEECTDRASGV